MNRKTDNIKMEWLIKAMHELQGRPELFDKNGRIGADILGHAPVTVRNIGTRLTELGLAQTGKQSFLTPLGEMVLRCDPYLERFESVWLLNRTAQTTGGADEAIVQIIQGAFGQKMQRKWEQTPSLPEEQMAACYKMEDRTSVELLRDGMMLFSCRYYIEKGMRRIYRCRECAPEECETVLEQSRMWKQPVICLIRGEITASDEIQNVIDRISTYPAIIVGKVDGRWKAIRAGKGAVSCESISRLLQIMWEQSKQYYPETPLLRMETLMADALTLTQRRVRMRVVDAIFGRTTGYKRRTSYMEEERLCRCVAEMTGANGDKQAEPVMNRILLQFHRFIDDARKSPQNLQTLYNTLQAPPYGLPGGIIPVLLAVALMEQKLDGVLRVAAVEQVICGKTLDNADKEPANYELYIENVFLHPQEYQEELAGLFDIDREELDKTGRFERTKLVADRIADWYQKLPLYTWSMGSTGACGKQTEAFVRACRRKRDRFFSFLYRDIPDCLLAQNAKECIQALQAQKSLLEACYPKLQKELCEITGKICGEASIEETERLAKQLMGVTMEYFQPDSAEIYAGKLQNYMNEKLGGKYSGTPTLEIVICEKAAKDISCRIYHESHGQTAQLLKRQIHYLIGETRNALEQEEKAAVLIRVLQEVIENDLS